ncbi:beta-lactamase regulating signal transducer with metallopeptidase domain [Cellvibrio fibrivorans]|uniref:Beta-lactamase regulating signal transducer with metallopeptidase domain n=1 Tax=Cellvibrio fibrivorans TaxID=126350 RepID=A0ABU1V1C7_9GAMM|nr:beta-lactamase regulating signal transducer with metallopeptidase domain [Cellvibrio fibrivorans]
MFTKHFSANTRYLIALGSLILSALISAITFYNYQQASAEIIMRPVQPVAAIPFLAEKNLFSLVNFINEHINSLVIIWLCGFLVYSLKTLLDYRYCQLIKNQHITSTPEQWQSLFATLAAKVGVNPNIELRISTMAITPCVIGYFKPVILLPISVLMGMNQQQIEVILLHELAHARRQDYAIGLVQTIIKTLFFFNPFLHWISHKIDKEREHACDDIAVAISKDPLLFANTLKEFANMNINQRSAMNITGNKLLLTRITRLFNKKQRATKSRYSLVASLLIIFSSVVITVCAHAKPENEKTISLNVAEVAAQDVMREVNKKCGSNETLVANANEKVTLVLEDISCKQAIQLLKDFSEGTAGAEPAKQ